MTFMCLGFLPEDTKKNKDSYPYTSETTPFTPAHPHLSFLPSNPFSKICSLHTNTSLTVLVLRAVQVVQEGNAQGDSAKGKHILHVSFHLVALHQQRRKCTPNLRMHKSFCVCIGYYTATHCLAHATALRLCMGAWTPREHKIPPMLMATLDDYNLI